MPAEWTGEIVGRLHTLGLNAKDLAAQLGYNHVYVSAVLNGRRNPKQAEGKFRAALDELAAQQQEAG